MRRGDAFYISLLLLAYWALYKGIERQIYPQKIIDNRLRIYGPGMWTWLASCVASTLALIVYCSSYPDAWSTHFIDRRGDISGGWEGFFGTQKQRDVGSFSRNVRLGDWLVLSSGTVGVFASAIVVTIYDWAFRASSGLRSYWGLYPNPKDHPAEYEAWLGFQRGFIILLWVVFGVLAIFDVVSNFIK